MPMKNVTSMPRLLAVCALALPLALFEACNSSTDDGSTAEVDASDKDGSTGGNEDGSAGSDVDGSTAGHDAGSDAQSANDGGHDANSGDDGGNLNACASPTDCPAPMTECIKPTCDGNVCGTVNTSNTKDCTDNGGRICDGNGSCVQCNEAANCPPLPTLCVTNTCDGHTCGTQNAAKGTPCFDNGGVVCDGNGTCIADHCSDGIVDADESDKDCGGKACAPCNQNYACNKDSDCLSKVCTGLCAAPSCIDGVQNQDETDKDCGGSTCGQCPDQWHCSVNADCASNDCFGAAPGTCVSCSDGVQDGDETGKDCGGAACIAQNKLCANADGCKTSADCQSGFCDKDSTCKPRPGGQVCSGNSQCESGRCGVSGTGHCCNTDCPSVVAACSATDCDDNGTCLYPGTGVTPAALQTPGDCQSITCNGSGGAVSVDNKLDVPTPSNECQEDGACCGLSPLYPCFSPAAAGTHCTPALWSDPAAHVCGDTSNSNIAGTCVECNIDVDCLAINDQGTLVCNTSIGVCE
jgi:hypothetical protein